MKRTHAVLLIFFLLPCFSFFWIYFLMKDVNETKINDRDFLSNNHDVDKLEHIFQDDIFDAYQEISESKTGNEYMELDDGNYYDFLVDRIIAPVINASEYAVATGLPLIIWWTPFSGDSQGKIKRCMFGDCFFSTNRDLYNDSFSNPKAFLFYGTDFNTSDLPLPRKRHHEWGLLHEESPKNQPVFLYKGVMGIFNHTSTFRHESSYPITTQYIVSASYLLSPLKYSFHEKDQMKMRENLSSIVYIQSGCNPPSDRDSYISELQKYINIDCYGKCLHNRDLPSEYEDSMTMFHEGFVNILQKYKFIISFENGICDDYITEKLYRTLFVGAIPIYKGAPNVRMWLPDDQSAIIADDFKTPKDLAEHIHYIDSNPAEYDKFFHYKQTGITNARLATVLKERVWGVETVYKMNFITGFECHVCDQIHINRKRVAEGKEPLQHIATDGHYGCPVPERYNLPSAPGGEDWERDVWLWEHQDAEAKVEELLKQMTRE